MMSLFDLNFLFFGFPFHYYSFASHNAAYHPITHVESKEEQWEDEARELINAVYPAHLKNRCARCASADVHLRK